MNGEKIALRVCRLQGGPAPAQDGSVVPVAGEIGEFVALARAEVQEQQRIVAFGELSGRGERLAVKLLPRHAEGLEAAVDAPFKVAVGRAKEHVDRTVHVGDVRGFLLKVEPSIQKDIDNLPALGNGEVMPIVIRHDYGAFGPS